MPVEMDEILIEIETDKVVLEVPAPADGVLAELVQPDGATVGAEQLIARIDTAGHGRCCGACGSTWRRRAAVHQARLRQQHRLPARAMWPCRPPPSCWPRTS